MHVDLAPKVADILRNTRNYHAKYYTAKTFGGPSLHFHRRALGLTGPVTLKDRTELIYAVLASWGMHRMGSGGSKMLPYVAFLKSVRPLRPFLSKASSFVPATMTAADWRVVEKIFTGIKVMASRTTVVGNSKVMAHFLPGIVPPIDREYTLNYLFGSGNLQNNLAKEWDLMRKILEEFFFPIAADPAFTAQARTWIGDQRTYPWDTGMLKVIDNLVIGAML